MKESKKLFKVQLGFGEDDKKLKRANNIRQIVFLAQKKSTLSFGLALEGRWIRGFGFGELLRLDLELDLSFWGWTRLSVSRRPESQGSLPLSLEADPLKFHFTTLRIVKLLFWISQFLRKWAWGRGSLVISFWCGSSRLQVGFPTNLSRLQVGFPTSQPDCK